MSAYLNTRVSLYSSRLWLDGEIDSLIRAPEESVTDILTQRGLQAMAGGYEARGGGRADAQSLEQRLIAQILDETAVLIRPLSGAERNFLIYWTERTEISNVKTLLRGKMTGERPAALLARLTPMGAFGRLAWVTHQRDVGALRARRGGTARAPQ